MSLIPELLNHYPNCNFIIYSSRTIDFSNPKKLTENLYENQRFRVYNKFIQDRIGNKTFTHIEYKSISSYLLINNNEKDTQSKELLIKEMLERTYINLPDVMY